MSFVGYRMERFDSNNPTELRPDEKQSLRKADLAVLAAVKSLNEILEFEGHIPTASDAATIKKDQSNIDAVTIEVRNLNEAIVNRKSNANRKSIRVKLDEKVKALNSHVEEPKSDHDATIDGEFTKTYNAFAVNKLRF